LHISGVTFCPSSGVRKNQKVLTQRKKDITFVRAEEIFCSSNLDQIRLAENSPPKALPILVALIQIFQQWTLFLSIVMSTFLPASWVFTPIPS
jgi:hypothetical protein